MEGKTRSKIETRDSTCPLQVKLSLLIYYYNRILLLAVSWNVAASCPGYILPDKNNTALRAATTHTRLVHDALHDSNTIQPQHMAGSRTYGSPIHGAPMTSLPAGYTCCDSASELGRSSRNCEKRYVMRDRF